MPLNGRRTCIILLWCLSLTPGTLFASAEADYEKALQAFQKDEQQAAYIHLKNVLQQAPDHIPAKVLMGKILLQKGYFNEAIVEFEESLREGADIELMLAELANSYLFTGKHQQVIALGQDHKLSADSQFDWHLFTAAAYLNLNDTDNARQHFQLAGKLQPDSVRLLNSQAALLLKEKSLKEAELLIEQALQQNNANPQSLQLKAELLQLQGQLPKAQQYYEQAVQLSPQDPLLRRALLRNYVSQYKTELAEATLQIILQQTPDDPYALLLSAWLSSLKQNLVDATAVSTQLSEKLWQLSKEQVVNQPSLLFSRALLSYVDGNYEKARSDLVSYNQAVPADLNAVAILTDVYIRQGDNGVAIQLLERHLAQLNNMPELAQRLITLYIRTNRAYKAEQLIANLRLQFPDNIDFTLLHAAVLKQIAQDQQARDLIAEQSALHSDNLLLRINHALLALDNKDYAQALTLADQLLSEDADNVHYLNFKAATLIKSGQAQLAIPVLEHILTLQPAHTAAQFNLATLAIHQQQYQQAIALLEPLVQLYPQHKPASTLLGMAYFRAEQFEKAETVLLKTVASKPYPPADELLFDLYFHQGRYQQALVVTEQALKRSFMDETLLWKKAQLLLLLKQPDESIKVQNLLVGLITADADKMLRLALMQRESADLAASGQSLHSALQLAPQHKLLQLELVNHYLITEQYNKAEQQLKPLAAKFPSDPNILMLQGDIVAAQQQYEAARKIYLNAIGHDPQFRLAWVKLYQLAKSGYGANAFTDAALKTLNTSKDPSWLRRLLAEHYVNQQLTAEAITQYETLLANGDFTEDALLHNNLANLYLGSDTAKALQHAEKTLALAPKQAFSLDTYGWVLAQSGQYQQAVAVLRQANALNATDPTIRFHIAYTLVKLQRQAEAIELLRQVLANSNDFTEKQQATQLLEQLVAANSA
ncbi:XrtA/PEP-CTERM system TPR-repeat protein PrsT [Rheinheimera hassiensis]|uniref:XrtA/PEP-CTERM system TPR-repeat protein PrsT n=1 Tax=Rheinheimera hassiensis TaxID=1193627 RepID=UPI001F0563F8|nr:XrtA/PEP-CTERM system TPR-repeat protein PrsT [Rheinheimera hassiensis]